MPKRKRRSRVTDGNEPVNPEHGKPKVDDTTRAMYDEIDEFHNERDQTGLKQAPIRGLYESDSSDNQEEVFNVEVPSSDSDSDLNEEEESDSDQEPISDSDVSDGEKHLPSADAWGKKRSTFYNTDFTGDDYGGLSGSDIEEAELEEQEARTLQQRLTAQVTEADYLADVDLKSFDSSQLEANKSQKLSIDHQPQINIDSMSDQEKIDFMIAQSPELDELIKEMNEKLRIVSSDLAPILQYYRKGLLPKLPSLARLQAAMEVYMNYIVNIRFYLYLKAKTPITQTASTRQHPVIDRIIQWKKLVTQADAIVSTFSTELRQLNDAIESVKNDGRRTTRSKKQQSKSQVSDEVVCERLREMLADEPIIATNKKKSKKQKSKSETQEELAEIFEEDDYSYIRDGETSDDDGRRAINRKIAKNRGLTPAKKRKERHSRTKRRKLYDKALVKRRSQVPNVQRELERYGGETRGIRAGLVKSTKLM